MAVPKAGIRGSAARRGSPLVVLLVMAALCLPITRVAAQTGDPVLLNEFLVSHSGADTTEYFELYGTPGHALAGLSLVVVEGDSSGGPGMIDLRVDLPADAILGGNGFYLVGNPAGLAANYGVTPDLALPCPAAPAACSDLVENGSQTVGLVATASLGSQGSTVTETEDVRDAAGLTDLGPLDRWFWDAPVLGPDDGFMPAGGRRTTDGNDTDTAEDWAFADDLLGSSNTPTPATPYVPPEPEPEPDPGPPGADVGALLAMVEAWVADGSVAAGKGHLLTDRLARIEHLVTDDRMDAAIAQLRALGNQAAGLAPRWMTPASANELADAVAALAAELAD